MCVTKSKKETVCVEEGRIDHYAGQDTIQRGAHVFSGAKAVRG